MQLTSVMTPPKKEKLQKSPKCSVPKGERKNEAES